MPMNPTALLEEENPSAFVEPTRGAGTAESSPVAKPGTTLKDIRAELLPYVERGGPFPEEYASFSELVAKAAQALREGAFALDEWHQLLDSLGPAFDVGTIQGYSRKKPRGYSGDYETIDRLHTRQVSSDPFLARWDELVHSQPAPKAVRNRIAYLSTLLMRLHKQFAHRIEILNVGSGPARDVLTFMKAHSAAHCHFTCVDHDANAIAYARALLVQHQEAAEFVHKNALRFTTDKRFHLIWSAGLFDYLDDHLFSLLLRRFGRFLAPGGTIVIGNFSNQNPTKDYMELIGNWYLRHRSPATLERLAIAAGFAQSGISVFREETGVNLFLHLNREI